MKLTGTTALILACLSTATLADSSNGKLSTATIQLANDQSGANANVAVPEDGRKYSIKSLWGKTAVAKNGVVQATSAQLVAFQQDTECKIFGDDKLYVELDARKTWAQLKGGKVVNLDRAYVVCDD
ncbi:uncharacterized protein N7469_008980 [Penicillium citrinum]|uniref:Uncharacterized protein n=2 Tax=Penicillium TaxID=5073 RepID=A0A9W9TIQ0_PENCI|nr:uncharacterized protein N7469_008980 [Penicillium citrinum]KAJ5222740.1 hypothetical protein N7469_008980 [Penicillium citrinum]KAJ5580903.1 hypothetical protein N7450_007204 [Penicillium hetheringtonii]KAK5788500.1 hypothetical protein VI817_009458 [Penicillium citrinum]